MMNRHLSQSRQAASPSGPSHKLPIRSTQILFINTQLVSETVKSGIAGLGRLVAITGRESPGGTRLPNEFDENKLGDCSTQAAGGPESKQAGYGGDHMDSLPAILPIISSR
jgi:hypothetical protein